MGILGGAVVRDAEFAELFASRARALRRTAFLLCGDWHRAEDLTQTAFSKLYAAWPRLRDSAAAEAYLRRTLTRTFLDDNKRASRRERPTDVLPESATVAAGSDERLMLTAALSRLPSRQRACVVLRYFDDLSVDDVADLLGCSTGTVKSNTSRGLDRLRLLLADDLPVPALIGDAP